MIEWQFGKCGGDFGSTSENGAFVRREVLLDQLLHQLAGFLGEFTRLDHRPVARCKYLHERAESEVHRKIPRTQYAHYALGFIPDLGFRTKEAERELDVALVGFRPAIHAFQAIFAEIDGPHDVGHHRLHRGTIAEIRAHGFAQILGMIPEQLVSPFDTVLAKRHRLGPHLMMGSALFTQNFFHLACTLVRHHSLHLILLRCSTRLLGNT